MNPAVISVGFVSAETAPPPSPASVAALVSCIEERLRIDPDRIYLAGQCEGAYQATDLLVTWPDRWAAAVLATRAKWSPLWANASAVPIRCYCNKIVNVDQLVMRAAVEWMRQQGCQVEHIEAEELLHILLPPHYQRQIVTWCLAHSRPQAGERIRLQALGSPLPRGCWLSVEAVQDAEYLSTIEAKAEGDTVSINTGGVTSYTIDLAKAPVDQAAPSIHIVENGIAVARIPRVLGQTTYRREPPAVAVTPVSADESPVLATVRQAHPDWQWQQWAADVACRQAGAAGSRGGSAAEGVRRRTCWSDPCGADPRALPQ